MQFSGNLKNFRLKRGKSTKELSGELGYGESQYIEWETGTSEPNYVQLAALAIYFECSADSLLGLKSSRRRIYLNPPPTRFGNYNF